MAKPSKREEKSLIIQEFLRKVLEVKDELFSEFSEIVTKETKQMYWKDVRDYAVAIGLVGSEKDFTYVRDATWPNLRNRTLAKLDKVKRIREEGGSENIMDNIDMLVLEIIGKEPPVIQEIPENVTIKEEIGEEDTTFYTIASETCNKEPSPTEEIEERESILQRSSRELRKRKRLIVRKRDQPVTLEELRRRKLQLEVRRLELDVWEKERELGVAHSHLTKNIKIIRPSTVHIEMVSEQDDD